MRGAGKGRRKSEKKGLGLGLRFFPRKLLIKRYIIPKDSGQKIYAQGGKKIRFPPYMSKNHLAYIHTYILVFWVECIS